MQLHHNLVPDRVIVTEFQGEVHFVGLEVVHRRVLQASAEVSLMEAHFISVLQFATPPHQSKDLQQGEDDLTVAHQGRECLEDLASVTQCSLAYFSETMCAGNEYLADFIGDHWRHGMHDDLSAELLEEI